MGVVIRLRRVGKTKKPAYRIVATDSRNPRDGKFIEILGNFQPYSSARVSTLDETKILEWVKKGAKISGAVRRLLKEKGLLKNWSGISSEKTLEDKKAKQLLKEERKKEEKIVGKKTELVRGKKKSTKKS